MIRYLFTGLLCALIIGLPLAHSARAVNTTTAPHMPQPQQQQRQFVTVTPPPDDLEATPPPTFTPIPIFPTPVPNANSLIRQGNSLLQAEDYVGAIAVYDRAEEVEPGNRALYIGRGIAFAAIEDRISAARDFARYAMLTQTSESQRDRVTGDTTFEITMREGLLVEVPLVIAAGQRVTITADSTVRRQVDPLLYILDERGSPISGDDDDGFHFDARVQDVTFPGPGDYRLYITHAYGGSSGSVTVEIAYSGPE